jgi:hypothetical protein
VNSEDAAEAELAKKTDNRVKTLDFEIALKASLVKSGHKKAGNTDRSQWSRANSQTNPDAPPE